MAFFFVAVLFLGMNTVGSMNSIKAEDNNHSDETKIEKIGYDTAKVAVDVLNSDDASLSEKNALEAKALQLKQSINKLDDKKSEYLMEQRQF